MDFQPLHTDMVDESISIVRVEMQKETFKLQHMSNLLRAISGKSVIDNICMSLWADPQLLMEQFDTLPIQCTVNVLKFRTLKNNYFFRCS